jgi:protocatechuate 3,4-dioxygenase beta subunit
MNKRDFLKTAGTVGIASLLRPGSLVAGGGPLASSDTTGASCVLIPSETAGPFPLDLSTNQEFFRSDVREDRAGTPLVLRMRVVGDVNCEPMPGVRVNIWHCDKDGRYSGYDSGNNPGQLGLTYLRGYQIADANGEVEFTTIFPGWYPGRVCHIHIQVWVSQTYAAVSQLTFPQDAKQALYAQHASVYTKGVDPLAATQDNIFADGVQHQVASLSTSDSGATYQSFLEVTVRGTGTTSVGYAERQAAQVFHLGQNSPNPCSGVTTIPFTLHTPGTVTMALYDLQGRLVHELSGRPFDVGQHSIDIDFDALGLPLSNYAYQLTVESAAGRYSDVKLLSVQR